MFAMIISSLSIAVSVATVLINRRTERRLRAFYARSGQLLDPPPSQGCTMPPVGWRCTRKPGHDGPCAAVPESHTFYRL